MFYRSKLLLNPNISFYLTRGISTKNKWDIIAAVCVERLPVVTPQLNELQMEYKEYNNQIELERSMKCVHEIRHENDVLQAELLKKNALDDIDDVSKVTAQDFEEMSTDELSKFNLASIETEADKRNDQKSLERDLRSHLVLLLEQQLGTKKMFCLPQGKHNEGETLRQTAERVLKESCGESVNVQIYGNAPSGVYKYQYPKSLQDATGAKVFFYYAKHISGQIKEDSQYKWLNRNELKTTLPKKYYSSINDFLVEERT